MAHVLSHRWMFSRVRRLQGSWMYLASGGSRIMDVSCTVWICRELTNIKIFVWLPPHGWVLCFVDIFGCIRRYPHTCVQRSSKGFCARFFFFAVLPRMAAAAPPPPPPPHGKDTPPMHVGALSSDEEQKADAEEEYDSRDLRSLIVYSSNRTVSCHTGGSWMLVTWVCTH